MKYPIGRYNKVHRLADKRADYDLETVHGIINQSFVFHVSFQPDPEDPFPTIIPMLGAMGNFDYPSAGLDEPLDCYIHGYISARMANLARSAMANGLPGLPVCISTAKVDGLILTLSAFTHSCNYRSAVLFGHASLVTDEAEKQAHTWQMGSSAQPTKHSRAHADTNFASSSQERECKGPRRTASG
jgi:nitroimidazol reductase NimA-like FMN-containing flavoprotein (pyridoxamine 5'-phosphate oxidase superfamily)